MSHVGKAPADSAAAVRCELAAETVRRFGSLCFPATGWSMLPVVWPGDTLVVDHVSPDQVRVGDVVVVGRQGRLCAHRVIRSLNHLEDLQWITQGDALPVPDRPVAANELLGKVAYLIRAGKLIAIPSQLGAVENLIAKVVRRSVPMARALVYLHRMRQAPDESVLPCQG
jgi:signal peptidase I